MTRPLIGSSLSTIVIFVPLAFLGGVTGGFFRALAVTMAAALSISLLFSLFIAPILARAWLRERDVADAERADALMAKSRERYGRWAGRAIQRPLALVAIVGLGLIALGGLAYTRLPSGFMPKMDEGGFVLDYTAHPGAALSDTDRLLRQVEAIIRATPDVDSYSRRTGAQLGGGLTEADEGDFFIHLKRGHRRNVETVMAEIRQKVQSTVPGLDIETAQLMEDLIGDLTAVPAAGRDQAVWRRPRRSARLRPAHRRCDRQDQGGGRGGQRPAGRGRLDHHQRQPAGRRGRGLDADAVSKQVAALIDGSIVTQIQQGETSAGVRLWTPPALRGSVESIGALRLQAPDGHDLPLSRVASVTITHGVAQITRQDLQPFLDVTARLEGRDLGSGMSEVRRTVAALHLAPSVRVEYGGLYAQQQQSFSDLAVVFAAALLLVTLLLLFVFERWAVTASVLGVVLMAAAAVFVGLWVTGTELDISALMGLTMVVGVVAELACSTSPNSRWTVRSIWPR